MPDDISIPRIEGAPPGAGLSRPPFTHSYRARRSRMEAGTRRLFLTAVALVLMLVGGMAFWTYSGHRAVGIPVIAADTKPLRVKPDNPGGMTVIGANEQILSGTAAESAGDMAAPAEKPDPQALRAQRQAVAAPAPAEATAPPPIAPPAAEIAPPPPPAPPQAPVARIAPSAHPATGGAMVQIAAVDSEAGASAEWQRLAKKMPDLLGDRRPAIQKAEHDGKPVWRLRTGGFADIAEATQFCQKLRAKGGGCTIASF